MPIAAERPEFAPHREPGALRSFGLAVLVHLLLIAALTWGVNWKHSNPDISFEAELWSSVPQEAAPKLVEAPPPPPPPPPPPEPVVKAPPPPPAPDVDIALEREKKRKLELKKKEAELAKVKAEQDRLKELQAKKEKEQKVKEDLVKRKAEETKKLEAKKADDKKQDAKDAEKKKLADAAAEKQRQDNIKRAMGLAGATGGADAKGTSQKASGPSASYGGKVRAKVKPNIVFTEDISGNPTAEVEVRTALDGSIISQRLIKSSGNKAWDDAVIKAIIRTETMPRDVDGRVPTPMILEFRPKD
ncbi:MAG: cell envelope integrity protein TolA [Polaromonas sp.]|uniref:cell envelope integrity protein TolA n=1 Tax=Polaromonas sp. TaxID=1869339 RepID=UPI002730EC79|nr:cell envelope integrity protein TolA [Polaromonas sp.]MDP2448648.1 cell envelope integrity protein TolA [Polaromonas sp.]MDP3248010.1 cell envelope integrity protein TolA [Polaromonas sp.]MDP3754068.1 cell envelope integrity protein TolA [Polaromonas sp.]